MPFKEVTDEHGFVLEGRFLMLYFPIRKSVLAYYIRSRINKGYEEINYGLAPFSFSGYDNGVLPAGQSAEYFIPWNELTTISPSRRRDKKAENMFYYELPELLLHVKLTIKPELLRNYVYDPANTIPLSYLKTATNMPREGDFFGYWRGSKEFVFLPYMEHKILTYNPTNMHLYTYLDIKYAEYEIELVTDTDTLRKLWYEDLPVKKIIMPELKDTVMRNVLTRAYRMTSPIPVETFLR